MKLNTRFTGLVGLVLIVAMGTTAWILIVYQRQAMHAEVENRARTVLSFGEACREYARRTLSPAVRKHTHALIFEADSATFVARGTFDAFRKRMPEYSFREAALNPLNPANRADEQEATLIRHFQENRQLKELTGYRTTEEGSEQFYVARPIVVRRVCLECHSSPERAPQAVVDTYGNTHGYGWEEGEINAAIMVTVPTRDIKQAQMVVIWRVLGTFLALTLVLVVLLSTLFRRLVNRRLAKAVTVMKQVESHPTASARLPETGRDELTDLACTFNSMADSLKNSHLLLEKRVAERTAQLEAEVAERKQAQKAVEQAREAAEAANRSKSEFLANMSHEIRTPMNGILGMTELALSTELTTEQRECLDLVQQSAQSLLTIINEILDFSKIEAGRLELDPIEFNLVEQASAALKSLAPRAHGKGLEIALDLAPGIPEVLIGDPVRLRQILLNLLGNAIKFTDHGEVILRIEVASDEPSTAAEGELQTITLHWSVRDTGIGIPPEKKQAIFDPFTQADGSFTRRYGGTGLGLTISSRLVQMMKGKLWVESEPQRGSTFHFTTRLGLPGPLETLAPVATKSLASLQVLLVEDNATHARILQRQLESHGARVVVVDSTFTAMTEVLRSTASNDPFQLILLDSLWPDGDGFMLVEQLRRHKVLPPAIILMLTTDRQGDSQRCKELGIAGYLLKPFKESELLNAILAARGMAPEQRRVLPPGPEPVVRPARSLHVLLAEDNPVNQHLVVRLLQKQGHTVDVVANGQEAIDAVEKRHYDLVLMDLQMPQMGGFEATHHIRTREQTTGQHLLIIALTAHAMKGDEERCLEAGMDGYLTKPLQAEALYRILDSVAQTAL